MWQDLPSSLGSGRTATGVNASLEDKRVTGSGLPLLKPRNVSHEDITKG